MCNALRPRIATHARTIHRWCRRMLTVLRCFVLQRRKVMMYPIVSWAAARACGCFSSRQVLLQPDDAEGGHRRGWLHRRQQPHSISGFDSRTEAASDVRHNVSAWRNVVSHLGLLLPGAACTMNDSTVTKWLLRLFGILFCALICGLSRLDSATANILFYRMRPGCISTVKQPSRGTGVMLLQRMHYSLRNVRHDF